MTLTATAQPSAVQTNLNKPTYKGRLGLHNVLNPSDAMLREMNKHVSCVPVPTKAQTAKMLREAMAKRPSAAVKNAKASASIVERYSAASYTSQDTLLWESWEGWTGEKYNQRPSNWAWKSNCESYLSETDLGPTWMQYAPDGYAIPYATDGQDVLVCLYGEPQYAPDSTILAPAPDQDEWIVSPTVSGIKATNYLSFDLCFTPLYTYLTWEGDEPKIDLDNIIYETEVMITTSTRTASFDEKNYTKVMKLSDVVNDMLKDADLKDSATLANLLTMRWQHFKLPLKEYDGKNIRIAFRYKGKMGGAVMLDAVRVSDMLPVAMYDKAEGSMYLGFSDEAYLNYSKNTLMPAYVASQWTNYSNVDSENFLWSYETGEEKGSSTERDLIMPPLAPGSMYWPELVSASGARNDMFNGGTTVYAAQGTVKSDHGIAMIGGNASVNYEGGQTLNFGVGNFDPTKLYWMGEIGSQQYAFGTGSGYFWAQMTGNTYNAVNGIANIYDAPASPYLFNTVTLPMGDYFNVGSDNLACTVFLARELEDGSMEITDEVLGQTTTSSFTEAGGGYILKFEFSNIMTINSPIAISITGIDDDNVISFGPLTQALNHDNQKGYSFVILKNQSTGGVWWAEIAGALTSVEGTGNMLVSHCMGMNAVFPYLHSNDGNLFEASTAGETKNFDIDTFWYPKKQDEKDVLNGWTIDSPASWISTEIIIDDQQQKAFLKITAQALPAGEKGRYAEVKILAAGCEEVIAVAQGDITSVETLQTADKALQHTEYTLDGRVADKGYKGVTVKNGKKIIK